MSELADRVEAALERRAGLSLAVEQSGDSPIVLSGAVESEELREAAVEIAEDEAPGLRIEADIEISGVEPAEALDSGASGSPADFTRQVPIVDPLAAAGPSGSEDDLVSGGDAVYVPPTDPVGTNTAVIGGFELTSQDSIEVARSSLDGLPGDEAIADAIRRELREDATTTALHVDVEVAQGVARLRGTVADLQEAEDVEAVAASVPGVVEVREELTVDGF